MAMTNPWACISTRRRSSKFLFPATTVPLKRLRVPADAGRPPIQTSRKAAPGPHRKLRPTGPLPLAGYDAETRPGNVYAHYFIKFRHVEAADPDPQAIPVGMVLPFAGDAADFAFEDPATESIERDRHGIADMAERHITIGNQDDRPHHVHTGDRQECVCPWASLSR